MSEHASTIDWEAVWRSLDWGADEAAALEADILARRALHYARPLDSAEGVDDALMTLHFRRAGERYALPVTFVQQTLTAPAITPLPCVPAYYHGVVNLRGRILSVLDLRRLWRLPAAALPDPPALIVVAAGKLSLAVLTDDVTGLLPIPTREIVPPHSAGVDLSHVQGVNPAGVVIVDVESLFADRKLIVKETL